MISHILNNYDNARSLYIAQTANPDYTKPFSNKIFVSGLALRFSNEPIDLINFNKNLIDNKFLLDYLRLQLTYDKNQNNVNSQSKNYFKCLELVYNDYVSKKQTEKANKIKDLAILISRNTGNKDLIDNVKQKYGE